MKSTTNFRGRQGSSGSLGRMEWRPPGHGSDGGVSDGADEAAQDSKSLYDRVLLENVSYALQARLAFSPYLAGASMDAVIPYADPEPEMPEPLVAARSQLQRAVLQRLRELQLLVEWPLLRPASTTAQMERLLAGGSRPSELVGQRGGGGPLDYPRLPPALQGLYLLGPMDFAVALAAAGAPPLQQQHLAKLSMDSIAIGQTGRGGIAGGGPGGPGGAVGAAAAGWEALMAYVPQLPRSLGVLPGLSALASLPWAAPTIAWLREFFRDLNPLQRHVGVDDRALPWFRDVKVAAARAVVSEGSARAAAAFTLFGVPPGVRAAVWETALGLRRPAAAMRPPAGSTRSGSGSGSGSGFMDSGFGSAEEELFERLCAKVLEQPLLLDVVVSEDVGPLAGDSEAFFLFEESIRAVLLAFLRDVQVAKRLAAPPLAQLHTTNAVQAVLASAPPPPPRQVSSSQTDAGGGGGGGGAEGPTGDSSATRGPRSYPSQPYYPPSGVVPCRGTALLAAPLCYLYENTAAAYHMFRAMYCRFWSKLQSLSPCGPPSPALPGLLRVFEGLMQELDPQLSAHLTRLGLLPATLALPWLTSAFSGALPVPEVLLLWDRIIGLDSLLPLPLLAVAVLCFRRHVLLSCASAPEVVSALSDISQLRAIPLLQAVLFPGPGPDG